MRHLSTFIRVLGVSFSLLTAPAIFANTTVSAKEADALIKDDIANAQVLIEMCPSIIGKNANLTKTSKRWWLLI